MFNDMIRAVTKRLFRHMLESAGYRVYHRDVLPYGIEFMLDIERLGRPWDVTIRTFFDIGATIGQTSSLALSSFHEAQVFAFEPHPITFTKLVQSLGTHPRFSAYNVALGNASGTVPFFEYSSSTLNSLVPDAQYPTRKGVTPREIAVDCPGRVLQCARYSVNRCVENRYRRVRALSLRRCSAVIIRWTDPVRLLGIQ
jgi:FkbM family methyltransferase